MDSIAAIAAVQTQGVDASQAQALEWLNAAYQGAVAAARYLKAEYSFGTTTINVAAYTVDDQTIVDVEDITVAGVPYERTDIRTIYKLNQATMVSNADGYFAADFSATGGPLVTLYPTPSTSGDAIAGLVAIEPTALDTATHTAILIPVDMHERLVDAAIALGKARVDGDQQSRVNFVQMLDELTTGLSRRRNAQFGQRPQILVRGFHF